MAKDSRINVRIPDYMKRKLEEEAASKDISVSDLVRFIFVAHYSNKK